MTNNNTSQLSTNVILNGHEIPVLKWQCHLTSYGNLCTFEVTSSVQALKTAYPKIFADQETTPEMDCKIMLYEQVGATGGAGLRELVFDGIVDTIQGTWEHDEIEITGRDYSAILRDKTANLTQYVTSTVSEVVTNIATSNGLTPNVQASEQIAGIKAATFQGESWSLTTAPQTLWKLISDLATDVGFVVFVDQYKILNFLAPGTGGNTHQYYWRPTPQPGSATITQPPILTLDIMQQSRRCNNFTLQLHGYDPNGMVSFYKTVPVGTGGGHFIAVHSQHLNSQNYKEIADNYAAKIQQKDHVVKMVVEGNTALHINDVINLQEAQPGDLLGLQGKLSNLFIVGLVHSFEMPDYGSSDGAGFHTHITCNDSTNADTGD